MSEYLLPLNDGSESFELVNDEVFKLRNKLIGESDGQTYPRYRDGHVEKHDSAIVINMGGSNPVTVKELEVIAQFCGVRVENRALHTKIKKIPRYVQLQKRKGAKPYILDTVTGKTFKES